MGLLYSAVVRLGLAGFLIAVSVSAQTDTSGFSPWQYVHAKAAIIGGVEWQAAKSSEFVRVLQKEMPGTSKSTSDLDFVERLDSLFFSAPEVAPGTKAKAGLVVLRGKFDLPKLRAMALKDRGRTQRYNDIEVLSAPDDAAAVAIIDSTTLLVGDRLSVNNGIRNRFAASPDTPLIGRAKPIAGTASIWLVADVKRMNTQPASTRSGNQMMDGLRSMAMTVNLRRSADIVVDLEADDEQHAGAFAALMQMMVSTQGQRLPALKIASAGNTARMQMSITPEQVRAGVQQFGQTVAKSLNLGALPGMGDARPVAQTAPETPLPPEKNVIKIYGLDEGVREIPVNPQK